MTEVFLTRGRSLEQLSTPTFSTNGTWTGGVWDGQKWDSIEGYAVSNVSTAIVIHQAQISGQWDISETYLINDAGRSAAVTTYIDTTLRGQYARLTASTASGITPSSGYFRVATWGKAAGQTEVDISGQTVKMSGESVVLNPSSMSGQAPLGIAVTSGSTLVLSGNTARRSAVIINDSDTTMWAAIGQTAVINTGIRLNPAGGTMIISRGGELFTTAAINAVHNQSGNKTMTVQELT